MRHKKERQVDTHRLVFCVVLDVSLWKSRKIGRVEAEDVIILVISMTLHSKLHVFFVVLDLQ